MLQDTMSFSSRFDARIRDMQARVEDLAWGFELYDVFTLKNNITFTLNTAWRRAYFHETQGLKFLEAVIKYILQSTEIETDKLVQSVTGISEKGGDIAMTTAEKLSQESIQEGRQEGSYKTMVSLVRNAKKMDCPKK